MRRISLPILIPSILLVIISLSTFYSIDSFIFKQQLSFFFIALLFYIISLNIDYKIFSYYSKPLYLFMVGLLLLLFFIGIEVKGSVRWVEFLGVRIQFSEVFKPFAIIFFASFLTSSESRSLNKFIIALILLAPIVFLTLKQPDLGNAMIYFFTVVFMLFTSGFPISYFIFLGIISILPLPFFYQLLHDYQKERILTFINLSSDPLNSSYNAIQSIISVGSGEFMGKGLGQATQSILKFLPERHNDFIFATLAESLGLVGSILVLSLYVFLLYKVIMIAKNVDDQFYSLIVSGFFFLFLTHIFFNVGMNIGLLPIVGITLPFLSYGGSSLLTNFIILGIISSITYDERRNYPMEIR